MKDLLKKYEEKNPEIVFHWNDPETDAEGWTVINSLRGGAAGGGTRMRKGLDMNEVLSLAKTMEIKFTVAGPPIGGAKSGINFDPSDPRKQEVLERWFKAVSPLLKNYYGTGGDMNVDQRHEVIPYLEKCGIGHPQEGVFKGHFNPSDSDMKKRIDQLRNGVGKTLMDPKYCPDLLKGYKVADMITGYGVAESVKHFYDIFGGAVQDRRAIVQGFGNVGAAAAYYLSQMGATIVGIIDKDGGIINEDGYSFEEIRDFFLNKEGNNLVAENMIPFNEINEKIWKVKADVFMPCAASRLVTKNQISQMIENGLQVISCGANVPFADEAIFFGPIMEYADDHLSLIPDFISNCGMARVFAYLMEEGADLSDEAIFNDASNTIKKAIKNIHDKNSTKTNLSHTAFEIALKQLL